MLQLSDGEQDKQLLVLSVANNLLKAYDPDKIAIEVVAFGPGIDLLRAESPNRARVDSLISQGVQFDICMNTVDTLEREGKHVDINPKAVKVQVGVGAHSAVDRKGLYAGASMNRGSENEDGFAPIGHCCSRASLQLWTSRAQPSPPTRSHTASPSRSIRTIRR